MAAQFATPDAVNFMATNARGLICLALTEERCEQLGLTLAARRNETPHGTAFTDSIEAREGVTTGISAADRSRTIMVAIDPNAGPDDLAKPGHVFPLRAQAGGVLKRAGHTEAAVDLARMAGLIPAGVICEVMKRRRHDGPRRRPVALCGRARPADDHRRPAHRAPPPHREAHRARDRRRACPRRSASSRRSATAASSTASSTSPWSWARSTGPRTCWCASTPSA